MALREATAERLAAGLRDVAAVRDVAGLRNRAGLREARVVRDAAGLRKTVAVRAATCFLAAVRLAAAFGAGFTGGRFLFVADITPAVMTRDFTRGLASRVFVALRFALR